ncbi:MAG: TetR/AcrR family transcriptional regulator [Myxococcota bacterium]
MAIDQKMSRERILAGAVGILDSGSCSDLTVDALARSLRMSKSTLYKYFPSKEDVVVALVGDACERAENEVGDALARNTATGRLTELAAVIGRHGQRLPRAVILDPDNLPPACANRMRATREAFGHAAMSILNQGVADAEFTWPEPEVAAVAFVASAEAVLVDGARRRVDGFGQKLHTLPGLFLPGLRATSET